MTVAARDQNFIPSKLACLNTDTVQGTNLVRIHIKNISGKNRIMTNQVDTISFTPRAVDPRDENMVGCWLFKSSTDGLTYPAVANASGQLLIEK